MSERSKPREVTLSLRPEAAKFAALMERELAKNDHKPGWQYDSPGDLMARLHEETEELQDALDAWEMGKDDPDQLEGLQDAVADAAADVANFSLMVCDVCGGLPDE